MSRPPAQYQAQTASYARVVNGGLIDFRDNTVRGNCDYPMYPNPIQSYAENTLQPALGTPGCIQGPPSYLHINGVTYKPVTDDVSSSSSSSSSSSTSSSGIEKSAERSRSPDPRDIERLVDSRVREKVDSYMSKLASKSTIKSTGKSMSDHQAAKAIQQINQSMVSSGTKRRSNPSTANW